MEKRYYLAYGSNLNVRQMKLRCPTARIVGTATIENYRLMFKGSKTGSYLTIEQEEGCSVPVGVWEVTEQDELRLDHYEGYPTFYYKTEMELPITGIRSGKVRQRKAFVYIMHEETHGHSQQYVYADLYGRVLQLRLPVRDPLGSLRL